MELYNSTYSDPIERKSDAFPLYGRGYFGQKLNVCTYQTRDKDGNILFRESRAVCYGLLPAYTKKYGATSVDISLYSLKAKDYNHNIAYWNFLLTDKRSPFAMYHKDITIVKDADGRISYYNHHFGDEYTSHMGCLAIATRAPYEHMSTAHVFTRLVKGGLDPRIAFLATFWLNISDDDAFYVSTPGGHHMYSDNLPISTDAFFHAKPTITNLKNGMLFGSNACFHGKVPLPQFKQDKVTMYNGVFPILGRLFLPAKANYYLTISDESVIKQLQEQYNQYL